MNMDQVLNYERSEDQLKDRDKIDEGSTGNLYSNECNKLENNNSIDSEMKNEKLGEIEEGQIEESREEDLKNTDDKYAKCNSNVKSKGICKYHLNGICHWGINCKFVHDGVNNLGAYKLFTYSNDLAKYRDIKSNPDRSSNVPQSLISVNDIVLSNPMDPYSNDIGKHQENVASPWEKALIQIRNLQVEKNSSTKRDETEIKHRSNYSATYHTPKLKLNDYNNHGSSKSSNTTNNWNYKENKSNNYYEYNSNNNGSDRYQSEINNYRNDKFYKNKSFDQSKLPNSKYSKRSREKSNNNDSSYLNSSIEDRKSSILKEMRDIEDAIKIKKNKQYDH